jgi:hypothetical protein
VETRWWRLALIADHSTGRAPTRQDRVVEARPVNRIALLEIIEAASGRIDGGLHSENEALVTALALVAARERQVLGDVTVADLAGAQSHAGVRRR